MKNNPEKMNKFQWLALIIAGVYYLYSKVYK